MESPEDIEKALAALVPSAISEQGQRSLDDLIDSLAAGEVPVAELPEPRRRPWGWAGGIGAAAAAVALAFQLPGGGSGALTQEETLPKTPAIPASAGEVVVSHARSEIVDFAEPEGWMSESNGVPRRACRVTYVNQEQVKDMLTGLEVKVKQYGEDTRLLPDNAF
ncbi:hypothetical protein [Luteolibacter sp. Populi]|uniref:hypothetical protein n=1 Tax=Luteolibacter sp. Populi TaxID=3230487 RepID=UPI003465FAFB